jgi:AraC-like DNA-binding protein
LHSLGFVHRWKALDGIDRSARSVQVHDLRRSPVADIRDPFHVLHFYLPRRVLDALSAEKPFAQIDDMRIQPNSGGGHDPTIEHLILSAFSAVQKPDEISSLFADHLTLALGAHVTTRYGGIRLPQPNTKGGLSPWQQRRALDLLHANLDGAVSLSELAVECGLSVRHFARAFKRSMGLPPHRYPLKQRIETARGLLLNSKQSLLDIALACGFADQSHFTRVFTAAIGVSPGAIRRASKDCSESLGLAVPARSRSKSSAARSEPTFLPPQPR